MIDTLSFEIPIPLAIIPDPPASCAFSPFAPIIKGGWGDLRILLKTLAISINKLMNNTKVSTLNQDLTVQKTYNFNYLL